MSHPLPAEQHWSATGFQSSTTQGSGGSFKDRKHIGEVGSPDTWAEQTHSRIDRWFSL